MQSYDSSTLWSSRESLSSTPSFPYSESDQTEDDEGDVFSEAEVERHRDPVERPPRLSSAGYPRDQLESPAAMEGPLGGAGAGAGSACSGQQPGALNHMPPTEGDMAFSRKCRELQQYLRPLLELLHGLKTGRFEKGLSMFQQSVAMDRLQRIVGVLQKPHLGERYLHTLQQIEMMLKVWFPQVHGQRALTDDRHSTPSNPIRHWHQDQLPVKKRRRSWSDSDSSTSIPPVSKRLQDQQSGGQVQMVQSEEGNSISCEHSTRPRHRACPRQDKKEGGGDFPRLVISPPCEGSQTDTQDSFISSTTPTSHRPRLPSSELHLQDEGSQRDTARDETGGAKVRGTIEGDQASVMPKHKGSTYCSLSCGSDNT